jgi:hypothetical protein
MTGFGGGAVGWAAAGASDVELGAVVLGVGDFVAVGPVTAGSASAVAVSLAQAVPVAEIASSADKGVSVGPAPGVPVPTCGASPAVVAVGGEDDLARVHPEANNSVTNNARPIQRE